MADIELLGLLYRQLALHSNEGRNEITAMLAVVQEIYLVSGKRRADIVRMIKFLQEVKILVPTSNTPLTFEVHLVPLEELEETLLKGSVATYKTSDLFQLLDLIECKPGVFLLEARLDHLSNFLTGYKIAILNNDSMYTNLDKLDEFSEFLYNEFEDNYRNSMLWYGALNAEFGSDKHGLEKFFEYMWKFRLQNNYFWY